jgi:hypothetical protein
VQQTGILSSMRVVGLAAVLVALVWATGALSAPSGAKPHLRLLDRAPFTVNGTHFRPRERVRLKVVAAETQTRSVRTSASGSFTTQFDAVSIGRCGSLSVRAVGAQSDQASLKVLAAEDCAPGLGP